ncbi:hypothetical protein PVA38_11070 [Streptococcus pneumoniae D39]|nr:hypothetical protein PVA38_11070 [Streptococcus pneumoniae D39]
MYKRQYLGRNYKVLASVGHIRDLKKSSMSVDIVNNYEPQYINCLLYTSPSPRDRTRSRMPSSA